MGPRTNKCDGIGKTASGNKIPSGGQGHQHPWATGILYDNTGYPNEVDYHRQRTSVKTAYSNIADAMILRRKSGRHLTNLEDAKYGYGHQRYADFTDLSGDQSVIYFEKKSNTVRSDQNFDPVEATKEEMWITTHLVRLKDEKEINIGSYNGKWNSPNKSLRWALGDKSRLKQYSIPHLEEKTQQAFHLSIRRLITT